VKIDGGPQKCPKPQISWAIPFENELKVSKMKVIKIVAAPLTAPKHQILWAIPFENT
jgi:hypothetical protein